MDEGGSGPEERRKEKSRGMWGGGGVASTLRMEVRRSRGTHSREGWRHQQGRGHVVAGEEEKMRQEVVSAGEGKPSCERASPLLRLQQLQLLIHRPQAQPWLISRVDQPLMGSRVTANCSSLCLHRSVGAAPGGNMEKIWPRFILGMRLDSSCCSQDRSYPAHVQ